VSGVASINERVRIATSHDNPGAVEINWAARQELLARLGAEHTGARDAFRDVGTSAPVKLTLEDKAAVLTMIEAWRVELNDDRHLPNGILDLRHALEQDLHDAGI